MARGCGGAASARGSRLAQVDAAERRRVKDVWLRHLGLALWCAPLASLCVALMAVAVCRAEWWWAALLAALALWNIRLAWKNLDAIRRWG